MDFAKESGKRLKAAREAAGLTLASLSKRTGGMLSASRISNYEQGTRQLGPQEALALCNPLGVKPSHLLCVDVEEDEGDMTQQEHELLRNFRALPERDRNDYSRRISVLALAYKEPVPDERLDENWTAPNKRRPKATKP